MGQIFCPLQAGVCFGKVCSDWLVITKIKLKHTSFLNIIIRKRPIDKKMEAPFYRKYRFFEENVTFDIMEMALDLGI